MKVLVTGGVRAGKTAHAESLLAGAASSAYAASGPVRDGDREPGGRARRRRPVTWDDTRARRPRRGAVDAGRLVVDCLGSWLTRLVDEAGIQEAREPEDVASYVDGDRARPARTGGGHC